MSHYRVGCCNACHVLLFDPDLMFEADGKEWVRGPSGMPLFFCPVCKTAREFYQVDDLSDL